MTSSGQAAILQQATAAPAQQSPDDNPVRVMVVDDSAVVRGLVTRWLDEDPGIEVVARHANGRLAVEDVARSAPDIILLDIEMPEMDGLEALPLLLAARPDVRVLMVSTLTKRNAEISFKALSLGALDYVPKPDTNREITILPDFRDEVIRKVKALAGVRLHDVARGEAARAVPFTRRPFSLVPPRIIAIGSSTGGPEALTSLLEPHPHALDRVAVLIAQHMPPMFTTILAERLARATGRETKEGVDGEPVRPGMIYVAPGNYHMTVEHGSGATWLRVADGAPVHFCRPAADPLFQSVTTAFGPAALGIVLTGMGQDGAAGVRAIADAGGSVMAQDEASSVVWGMPAAAAATGACAAILPPPEMAKAVAKLIEGKRP